MFYNFYFCSKHWSFIIVCPDFKFGYIVDSINEAKTHKNYKPCKQQKCSWKCWYMVIKHMKEFIDSIQHDLVNRLWNEEEYFEESQFENLVVDLMSEFIKKLF
ncbi:hypothetical protein Hanom_Chr00s000003g01604151 [Helianthus anomalus]